VTLRNALVLGLAVGLAPGSGRADDALAAATPGIAPDSFAIQAIAAPDLQVTRPGSLKEASAAMGAFVKGGKLAPGAAVEVTPWDVYFDGLTYSEYVAHPWMRRLVNLALSLATVGGAESEPVRSALAARLVLWDDSDWRLNDAAIACVRAALPERPPTPDAPFAETLMVWPELNSEQAEAVRQCRTENTRWNASQAAFGAALTASTPGGSLRDTRPDGAAGWFSIAAPLGKSFQLLGSARYTFRKSVAGEPRKQVAGIGTRLTYHQHRFVLSLDAGAGAQRDDEGWTGRGLLGLSAQVLVWGSTWVDLAGAQDLIFKSGADQRLTVTANLRWNHDIASGLR
jgi:hypothetical protein